MGSRGGRWPVMGRRGERARLMEGSLVGYYVKVSRADLLSLRKRHIKTSWFCIANGLGRRVCTII